MAYLGYSVGMHCEHVQLCDMSVCNPLVTPIHVVVVVVLLFYVHGKHLRSCRDGQLT